jgi:hypothetical protein
MDFRWVAGISIWTMLVGPACAGLNHWQSRRSVPPECPMTSTPPWLNTSACSVTSACVVASPVSNSEEEPDE